MHKLVITYLSEVQYIYIHIHTHTHIDNNRREKGTSTLDVYSQGGQTVS